MKPCIVDLPYPSVDGLTRDVTSGQIISFAYATQKGELTAILQYLYHGYCFESLSQEDYQTYQSLALAEMIHLKLLGRAMLKLGVPPKYVQYPNSQTYYNTACVAQSTTVQKMLMDDLQGELNAIAEYKKMLFAIKNEQVSAIIQRILLDEELHLETLRAMMKKYS